MSSRSPYSSEMGAPGAFEVKMEERLQRVAAAFPYPTTPDLAARERQRLTRGIPPISLRRRRRLAFALAAVFLLLAGLLVSPVRARVLDWIRIGAVRIFFTVPTPTATQALPSGTPSPAVTPTTVRSVPTIVRSVLDIGGETTFANAQQQSGFTIQMPAYPPDLGAPDHVFLQTFRHPVVVLVWMDPDRPDQVRMSLSETTSDEPIFEKYAEKTVQETEVGGSRAVWIDGEYLLILRDGEANFTRLMTQGHTLIWTAGEMTYRLETDEDLETAIRIAESIR